MLCSFGCEALRNLYACTYNLLQTTIVPQSSPGPQEIRGLGLQATPDIQGLAWKRRGLRSSDTKPLTQAIFAESRASSLAACASDRCASASAFISSSRVELCKGYVLHNPLCSFRPSAPKCLCWGRKAPLYCLTWLKQLLFSFAGAVHSASAMLLSIPQYATQGLHFGFCRACPYGIGPCKHSTKDSH